MSESSMTEVELRDFLRFVIMLPNSLLTGSFQEQPELKAKVEEARALGYLERVDAIGLGRYSTGFKLTHEGRMKAVQEFKEGV